LHLGLQSIIAGGPALEFGVNPATAIALIAAFAVGLSMNFMPCNAPVVLTLLPSAHGAKSFSKWLEKVGLYMLGGIVVLGVLGFILGYAGESTLSLIYAYKSQGVVIASTIFISLGVITLLWGFREFGIIRLPRIPFFSVRAAVEERVREDMGRKEQFLMGAVYAGAGAGCPMPTYHVLLIWAVVSGSPIFGAILLAVYVLGRMLPVVFFGALAFLGKGFGGILEGLGRKYELVRLTNGMALVTLGSFLALYFGSRILLG
jgi:cytochrome c-type biogenesis protein